MNPHQLLAHYDRIADASDAVGKLREFVLALAVQGKLVPQFSGDQSLDQALKVSRMDAPQRAASVGRMRWEPSSAIGDAEMRDLPEGWVAARVNDTGFYVNGLAFKPSDWAKKGVPIIRIQNLTDPTKSFNFAKGEFPDEVTVRDGDILVSWSATLDAFIWKRGEGILNQHIFRVLPDERLARTGYLHLVLRNAIRELGDGEHARGLVMTHIKRAPFLAHVVGLPPLQEQDRILAKVDELMALCDQLDAARAEREATRDRLAVASLARLNTANPDTVNADANFVLDALAALTARPDQINRLRQWILALAVTGKLISSSSNDVSARVELEKIYQTKRANALRKPKEIAEISADERWCELPAAWTWARWDHIADWITYGFTRPMPQATDGVPVVTGKNVNYGRIVLETAGKTSVSAYRQLNEKDRPKVGDILVTKDGSIGRTAIVSDASEFCINQSVAVIWLRSCHLDRRYLQLALDCPQTQGMFLAKAEGVAIKHISVVDLGRMVFPLPPLAEQKRIVARVDELMSFCNQLESSLGKADNTRRRLLDALLAEALQPVLQAAA